MHLRVKLNILLLLLLFVMAGCNDVNKRKSAEGTVSSIDSLRTILDKGRTLQRDKNFADAIKIYRQIIASERVGDIEGDSLLDVVSKAMMQAMNSYQCLGKSEDCVALFDSLRENHTRFIDEYAMRDLYIISAYATSRTDDMGKAEQLADSALKMPLRNATPERLFRDYAYAAAVFFANPSRQSQVKNLSQKALEEAKQSNNNSGAQYVTTMLGMIYRRMGQLPEAINLYLESLAQAEEEDDTIGQATACNTLADLYLYWKLPQFADIYASKAVGLKGLLSSDSPMTYAQSLLLKGATVDALGKPDSALIYFKMAATACRDLPYTNGMADVDYHIGKFLVHYHSGDSLNVGIQRLKRVVASGTSLLRAKAFYGLAEGYDKLKDDAQAKANLDSMYNILHQFSPPQYIDIDYKTIINAFAQQNDMLRTKQYAIDLAAAYVAEANVDIRSQMYETIVELETKTARQQLDIKEMKLASERQYWQLWLVLLGAIIVLMSFFMVYRRKITNAKRLLMEKELSSLLDKLESAKQEKIDVEQQKIDVEQQLADIINKGKRERANVNMEIPMLLSNEGVDEFRSRFERIYPDFVTALRERVPNISRTEELHCMLIALGQGIQQVSTLMGIAYRSVNMARYRLRKKFNLTDEETLESAVKQFLEQ